MEDKYAQKMAALIAGSALKIYGCHSHAGKAYIDPLDAVQIAAMIIGAAQSKEVLDLVRYATSDPRAAIDHLRRAQGNLIEEIDADRKKQMRTFAEVLKTDNRQ